MKTTNNNRRKMKRKKQPEVFWNLNNKTRSKPKRKVQKIVLVQPIKLKKQKSFALKVNKQKWNVNSNPFKIPKVQVRPQRKTVMKSAPFMSQKQSKVPRNSFMFNNLVSKKKNYLSYLNGAASVEKNVQPGNIDSIFPIVPMTPASFLRKESIYDKELRPWGDVDMDGSVNHMDCDPRDVSRDGIVGDIIGKVKGGVKRLAAAVAGEKEVRRVDPEMHEKRLVDIRKEKKGVGKKYEEDFDELEQELESTKDNKKRAAIESKIRKLEKREDKELSKLQTEGKKIEEAKQFQESRMELLESEDPSRQNLKLKRELAQIAVEEKLAKGKKPTMEEMRRLTKAERAVKDIGKTTRRRIVSQLTGVPFDEKEQRLKIVDPKTGRITKKAREAGKSLQRKISRGLKAVLPAGAIRTSVGGGGEGGGRGRPKGPSGKYLVDGVPVSEAEFQQIRSAENKKRRQLGLAKIPTRAFNVSTVKQAVPREEVGSAVPQRPQRLQEEEPREEYTIRNGEAVPEELYEEPAQPGRRMTVQEMQEEEQRNDNVLNAPSIMKGHLQQTAGIFQEDPRYNILNAPNFNKGGLRRAGETEEVPAVQVGERPNPNPYEDEYTDIDPGSGRAIVKRRPSEKWVTGEAI